MENVYSLNFVSIGPYLSEGSDGWGELEDGFTGVSGLAPGSGLEPGLGRGFVCTFGAPLVCGGLDGVFLVVIIASYVLN